MDDEWLAGVNKKYLGPQIANFGHNIRFIRKFTLNVRTRSTRILTRSTNTPPLIIIIPVIPREYAC